MKKYKMILGDFECVMVEPSKIRFWIENEIGNYDGKAERAEKWCKESEIGDIYDDEFLHIEVLCLVEGEANAVD